MADTKVSEYDLPQDLTFPLALVDPLSVIQEAERGNTPRPSRARLAFVTGVSAIQKKQFENAFKQLTSAVAEAEKDKKDKETLAVTLSGLGFLCACVNQYDKAAICYLRALKLWLKVHSEAKQKLIQFMLDTTTVLKKAQQYEEAYSTLEQARTISAAQRGETDTEVQGLVVGLAELRMKQKKTEEAIVLYESALKVLHESGSPQEVQLLHLMITLYEAQKNTEAVNRLKEALKVAQAKHGI
jgi:tetratricopeptide (TPR) repeat protein